MRIEKEIIQEANRARSLVKIDNEILQKIELQNELIILVKIIYCIALYYNTL